MSFIHAHMEEILAEWESFARTLSPAATTMDALALRDHAQQMLEAIARDIETHQTSHQQLLKSRDTPARIFQGTETAAAFHGMLRHASGFDLRQLVAEFRALRATVLRLWEREVDSASAYEIARFNEAIDQALAESVATYSAELAKSRDTFLAILGHDLRSPLAALSGAFHVLSKSTVESQRELALAAGVRSVAGMNAMIRDLLEYTRTRLGKGIPVSLASHDLRVIGQAVIDEVTHAYPETGFHFDSRGDLIGMLDADRMHQALANLVNNAVQHGKRGRPVRLTARGEPDHLFLEVRNEGVPIPAESLQVIFDPLVQLPREKGAAGHSNLGLGLFIAREIAMAHGGTIQAASTPEAGTAFTIRVPRVQAGAEA
jgi:signal transduction histidine kinase